MKVLVNNSLYEMGRKEYRGVLKVASQQVPCGICSERYIEYLLEHMPLQRKQKN